MLRQVRTFIESNQLINIDDIVYVAVSGGGDSIALLHCLNRIRDDFNFQLRALHVNHGIRGEDAERDEQFAHNICAEMKIPFEAERLTGLSIQDNEEKLREARYAVFYKIKGRIVNVKIATAHHLDDQLETILMRLAKGSSLKGLCGIPARRDVFIRPLLSITRTQIETYLQENDLKWREDKSNKDLGNLRSQIRRKITPALNEVFGADFYAGLNKSIGLLNKFYEDYSRRNLKDFNNLLIKREKGWRWPLKDWNNLSTLQRRQLLEYCISKFYPLNFGFSFKFFEEFETFVSAAQTGSVFNFKHSVAALKDREFIIFSKDSGNTGQVQELYPDQAISFRGNKIIIREVGSDQIKYVSDPNIEYISGDNLFFPMTVRSWEKGDFFYPLGSAHKQKLSDFFINQKIDLNKKKETGIIVNKNEIVWLAGKRLDNRYRVTDSSKTFYCLQLLADD